MRSIETLNDHLGTDHSVCSSDMFVLTSLLAVRAAVLTTWTLVIKVLLEVSQRGWKIQKEIAFRMVDLQTLSEVFTRASIYEHETN